MAKVATLITQSQPITAVVGNKTTVVNASSGNAYLTTDEIDAALADLPFIEKQAVLNSLYSIEPGKNKSLTAGTYNLSFAVSWSSSAVLIEENNS